MEAPAPYESMPIFVKAGSIIPVGPELQYTVERPADPITLYVYAGADGAFTLYEDEGVNYNYEHGGFTRIVLHWDDRSHTLTIGARHGSFRGMLTQRTFAVILISKTKPVGFSFTPQADRTVNYDGQELKLQFEGRVPSHGSRLRDALEIISSPNPSAHATSLTRARAPWFVVCDFRGRNVMLFSLRYFTDGYSPSNPHQTPASTLNQCSSL